MRRRTLLALLLLALAVAGAVALSRLRPLLGWAQTTVLKQVTASLGREVSVGGVELRPWGVIVLRDVALARWERLAEGTAFEARAITLSLRLLPLLRGRVEIGSIRLTAPRLWVEVDEEGRNNWEGLLKRPRSDGLAWSAVRIAAGELTILDRRHGVTISGRGAEGQIAPGPDGKFRAGRGELSLRELAVTSRDRVYPTLALKVRGGWAGPALDLSELTAAAGGSSLRVQGRIEDLRTLEGSLRGTATVALRELASFVPAAEGWNGSLALSGTLTGSWRTPVLEATAKVEDLTGPRALRVTRARGQVGLRRDTLRLAGWTVEAYGGRFEGEATATPGPRPRYQGQLRTAGLKLAALPAPVPRLAGEGGGTLTFRGEGREVVAEATVELANAAPASREGWERLPPFLIGVLMREGPWRATGRLAYADGRVTIESARLASGAHRLSGNGTIGESRLALAVELETSRIAAFLPPRLSALEGAAHLTGRIEGPFRALRVSALAEGRRLRWEGFSAESLRAEVGWSDRTLTVPSLVLSGADGRLAAHGTVEFACESGLGAGTIAAEGDLGGVSLAPLLARAGLGLPAAGRVSGQWQWHQRGEARTGRAVLTLESGSLAGEPIPAGRAALSVDGTTVTVSALQIQTPAGDLRGEGVIEPGGRLDGHLEATIRSLAGLRSLHQFSPPLDGEGTITLDLGGTPRDPRLSARGDIRGLRLGALSLGRLDGRARWDGSRATLSARLPTLAVTLEGEGGVGKGTPYRVVASLAGSPLGLLAQGRPQLIHRLGEVAGSATGEVMIEGEWGGRPRGRGEFSALALGALGEEWRSVGASRWGYAGGRITLDGVRLESRAGRLEVRGSVSPGEAWDLGLQGQVPLSLLEGVRGGSLIERAQGTARGELTLTGAWQSPRLRGRLTLDAARLQLSGLDQAIALRRGEVLLEEGRVRLTALEGEGGGGTFTASGESTLVGWRPDRFSVHLVLRGQTFRPAGLARAFRSLGLAPPVIDRLAGQPLWEEATVRLAGAVRLEGRWGTPSALTASGDLTRLELLTHSLHLVSLDPVRVRYSADGLGVEPLRLVDGGTRVTVSGTVGTGGELDLGLDGQALRFRVPEVGHGTVDAALRLSGGIEALTLAGRLTLRRAVYSRSVMPAAGLRTAIRRLEEVLADLPPALKALRLNLDVEAPGEVWVRNDLARLELRAQLSLRGTLGRPLILGRAEALQGSVVYRRREFKILSATADLLDPRRLNPRLTVTAETTVQAATAQLYLTGTLDRFTIQLSSDPPLR